MSVGGEFGFSQMRIFLFNQRLIRMYAMSSSEHSKRFGFTLIELLVVVVVIVVLIAILLPSLGRARDQSKTTVCGSNLRQLGVGFAMYSVENQGSYPPLNLYPSTTAYDQLRKKNWWVNKIATYIPVSAWYKEDDGNASPYVTVNNVWRCPSLGHFANYWGGGYSVASTILGYNLSRKITQVSSPTTLFLVGEGWIPRPEWAAEPFGTWISVAPHSDSVATANWELTGSRPCAPRHRDNTITNITFFDNHVEPVKYTDAKKNIQNLFTPVVP